MVDLADDVADDVAFAESFGSSPGDVVDGGLVEPHSDDYGAVDGGVQREEQIRAWVSGDGRDNPALSIVKIQELLARSGCLVPYRTLPRLGLLGFG